jgi:DNA polymerase I-like protein with 3'-5' exonuclease and polymerase domains
MTTMSDWQPPTELPDLRRVGIIGLDTETRDDRLRADKGSGWATGEGYVCGVSVAYHDGGAIRAQYFPLRHPDTENFDPQQVFVWLRDLIASGVRFVGHNISYDFGWLHADGGVLMPPGERLEETLALATLIDENRYAYGLDNLCRWRGLPGKDETLLVEATKALGEKLNKHNRPQSHIWRLPARFVGPYAEGDGISTLLLYENLSPILALERTQEAYRLECDLLPMVHAMRRRGIRIDTAAAEQKHDILLQKRDAAFAELSDKLGAPVGMEEIGRTAWLATTFDRLGIKYPHTEKGNPSFTAGWMQKHLHWLPQLIVTADKYNNAAVNVLGNYILGHAVKGRIHAEIHPHRSDEGGTRSLRFSYSDPPLQLMPSRDEELAPLIRGVFLPEEDEAWASCDASQQEFRFLVHHAAKHNLRRAKEAVELYNTDPKADFHAFVAQITGLDRQHAKAANFAKIYGAGPGKFAAMINKPLSEARAIYDQYDRQLPFAQDLARIYQSVARNRGYIELYDGARRHFESFEALGVTWTKGAGPCSRQEAERRCKDPEHPWYRRRLRRAETHKALNALIQGSAARHTKLWMRACWREGFVSLLQMHDALELSVASPEQAERVHQLGCEAVKLAVPMRVDLKFGRTWGDVKHSWEELHGTAEATNKGPQPCTTATATDSTAAPQWSALAAGTKQTWSDPDKTHSHQDEPAKPYDDAHHDNRDHYRSGEQSWGRNIAEYIYRGATGAPYLKVVRTTTKQFPQFHWESEHWVKRKPTGPKIPYRLPELLAAAAAEPVWITEGEKDADNVAALGLIATTNSEGAGKGKWTAHLNSWFRGKQTVYILEDNDADGRRHAGEVADALRGIVPEIYIISFPELPPKGDVSDWLEMGGTKAQLLERAKAAPRSQPKGYVLVRASEIVPRRMDWLWQGHLLRGSQELLTGIPGTGKSQIHCAVVAYVTTGGTWPDGCNGVPASNVIMLTAEDCLDQTIVPRLIAAGADRDRVFILRKIRKDNKERMFLLNEDLDELEWMIRDTGDVRLITIDPITAYMGGKVDSHRATDVRGQLGPLADLSERMDVALSAITHPPKQSTQRAIDHFIGSQAFIAAARIGHMAIEEVEEDEHGNRNPTGRSLFTNPKNNVSAKMATLAYRVVEKQLDFGIKAPQVIWEEIVDITADQAVAATQAKAKERSGPMVFLQDVLTSGPVPMATIEERGAARGFSKDQLHRAKRKLGIVAFKEAKTLQGRWFWALPQHAPLPEERKPED